MSWTFNIEVMDTNRTGDTKMGALTLTTTELIDISNGTHWLPLEFEGDYAGEIEVVFQGIDIAPRPLDVVQWSVDHLEGFEQLVLPLVADKEGPLHATLVRRMCPRNSHVAILSIHGFSDYFWNGSMGRAFSDDLYNFYALDLRKCGRSRNPNHRPGYVSHFEQYFEELHAALRVIRVDDGNSRVVIMGTGTGAVIATLYASEHAETVDALLLNSPAFSALHNFVVPKPWFGGNDPFVKADGIMSIYHTSLHKSMKGEWDFDLEAKPIAGMPLYQTWLTAFTEALQRIQKGEVIVRVPTLVLCSAAGATTPPQAYNPGYQRADVFLNIAEVVRLAPKIGGQVRLQLIREAVHDVFLSGGAQRDEAYDKMFDFFTFLFENGEAK
jgi:alpha-beta hydrolase superfamily lysophospholipase